MKWRCVRCGSDTDDVMRYHRQPSNIEPAVDGVFPVICFGCLTEEENQTAVNETLDLISSYANTRLLGDIAKVLCYADDLQRLTGITVYD